MNINEDLKQPAFKNESIKTIVNILHTSNWIEIQHKDVLKHYDITLQQYNVLRILRGNLGNMSNITFIKERMIDKSCDASRLLERLIQKKFIEKRHTHRDKRVTFIEITALGLDTLTTLDPVIDKVQNILHILSTDEIDSLNHMLDKIRTKDSLS